MIRDDDKDYDAAICLQSTARQLDELAACFRRSVGRRLQAQEIAERAITTADREAIEDEVLLDAIHEASGKSLDQAHEIFGCAVDETVRLILVHISETSHPPRNSEAEISALIDRLRDFSEKQRRRADGRVTVRSLRR